MKEQVTHFSPFDMQVCVPKEWTDEEVETFAYLYAEEEIIWVIIRQGNKWLGGDDERVVCSKNSDFVHIMLDEKC